MRAISSFRPVLGFAVCTALFVSVGATAGAPPEAVSKEDARQWLHYLVPLPRSIELQQRLVLPPGDIRVSTPDKAPPLVRQGADELVVALGSTQPEGEARPVAFRIMLTVDAKAPAFQNVRNQDQAYLITPSKAGDALLLVGGGERGAYYASKTVQQFIRARRKPDRVEIPLAKIVDWPDMADRGLWGGDSYYHLRWMSDRKMNYDEQIATNGVSEEKRPFVNLGGGKRKMVEEGPTYGINPVPVVLHLEQIAGGGIFKAYPELKGKDGKEGTICYSNPLFADLLAQWLLEWRKLPGVTEVDVWMAENLGGQKGCQCEQCKKEDRSVLEARAIVAAYHKARAKDPQLGLRVLTSEETEKANPAVLAELPPEVKLWYYHSLYTYNSSRRQMIRPYLVEAIRKGRWIGVCPNLCAQVGTWQPFTAPQFIHSRMNEFVDKGLSGLLGYAVPCIPHTTLNTEAAAEWTWNAKGRSPREFAISWAVRQGVKAPERFADWCDLHVPVAWDVYGSEWPAGEKRGHPGQSAELLKKGKLPDFGEVLWEVYAMPWGEIKSAAQLEANVIAEDKALELARQLGQPAILQETLTVQGYIHALQALYGLKTIVKPDGVAEKDKPAARKWFKAYFDGLEQARTAIPEWERIVTAGGEKGHYTKSTAEFLGDLIAQMKKTAADVGCLPAGR